MIETTLAFDARRRSGDPPQVALFVQLAASTLVIAAAGVEGLDEGVLWKADGAHKADGSIQAGTDVQTVYRSLIEVGDLEEGDESGGDPRAPRLTVMPSRKTRWRVVLDNATGLMGDLLVNEPLVAKRAELRLLYPGLALADMPVRFSGEVLSEELTYETLTLELQGA